MIELKEIDELTIDDVVGIHFNAYLDDHFTNALSVAKLKEYYLLLAKGEVFSFVLYVDARPAGFLLCGEGLNTKVKAYVYKNFLSMVWILLRNPRFLFPKIKSFLTRFRKSKWRSKASVRVLSIAVSKDQQGRGIGKKMMQILEDKLREHHEDTYGLSVKNKNVSAITFYESIGFVKEHSDAKSSYYWKSIK